MNNKRQMQLDSLDRRILTVLQNDAGQPLAAIAEVVGSSESSVRRRIKRLRTAGVIDREVALLNHRYAGIEIIVSVSMNEEHSSRYDALKKRFLNDPAVSQCYRVTGEVDMILHVRAPDMSHYEVWLEDNILADPAVRRCTSYVVYSRIKFSTEIALDD
ncbi:Lrp/AsnC family transcriptional regulator [Erythrobacter sp. JK5]|uniref:Lrp/AsnC family transcriptional regulator n=1 Tax=Erythrobacter sp. JK5 TaxID=2829500 RepID=UPI001BAE06BC|nr:Lrp/AsnC family transcriptional regulator [Erythrobacter sp. JK5]QUL37519.1 Lrp/AsnC family transcriptional regulator [Erythrobacter sp. JK5]